MPNQYIEYVFPRSGNPVPAAAIQTVAQTSALVFAGPSSGGISQLPTFRFLNWMDIPAKQLAVTNAITADSTGNNSASYTSFATTTNLVLTFTPLATGPYRLVVSPIMARNSNLLAQSFIKIASSAGATNTPTWISGGELFWTQAVAADDVDHSLEAIFNLTQGLSYSFQLQYKTGAGAVTWTNSSLSNGTVMYATQL